MQIELRKKVEEFVNKQPPKVQAKIARSIDLLDTFGLRLTEPHLKKLKDFNFWELRIIFGSNIYRIFVYPKKGKLILIHGFCKKSRKTPLKEIKIAIKRIGELK